MESDLIELSPNGDQIRRRVDKPLFQSDDKSFDERTVILKGIPKETTSDELLEWAQQLGPILEIRPLKTYSRFNGCALVTFAIIESAEKVVNQSVLKLKGIELSKEFYLKSPTMG